jgi:hypothetical protein
MPPPATLDFDKFVLEKRSHVHIQWCLKGIGESSGFGDAQARALLTSGIPSNWLRANANTPMFPGLPVAQDALSPQALFDHVNDYTTVGPTTPYISLSAGVVAYDGNQGADVFPAWETAVDFATSWSTRSGYVFRVWTVVSPKAASRLLNVSDEVRNLNLFRNFTEYHYEGEVAAKILVPARQIEWVAKVNASLTREWLQMNVDFVKPETVSNLLEEI